MNKEERLEYDKQYRAKNAEKLRERGREYGRAYRSKNKEKLQKYYKEYNKEYREKNRERLRQYQRDHQSNYYEQRNQRKRERRETEKKKVYTLLGKVCSKCGFSDERALQIDHINGNGYVDKNMRRHGYRYYKHIVDVNGEGYQVLCANCNWIKAHDNKELIRHRKDKK